MSKKPSKGKTSPLADYIRSAVDAKYKTRTKAAKNIGIEESILSRICSNQRVGVSDKVIETICGKLGLDKSEGVLRLFLTKHRKMRKMRFVQNFMTGMTAVSYLRKVFSYICLYKQSAHDFRPAYKV